MQEELETEEFQLLLVNVWCSTCNLYPESDVTELEGKWG